MAKLVSVIIRTCGDRIPGLLLEAIQSVSNQNYADIEIVVVEDGGDLAEKHLKGLKNVVYKSLPKSGRCVTGNTGLEIATGEYLVFLDDDDQFMANHVSLLAHELDTNPDIDAVYSKINMIPTEYISFNPPQYVEKAPLMTIGQPFSRILLWKQNYIPILATMFRRKLYELYGGFDLKLDQLEDWDLWIRYSLHNDFKFIDQITSFSRIPMDKTKYKQRIVHLNEYYDIVVNKQKDMTLTTNPFTIIEDAEELNAYLNIQNKKSYFKNLWYALGLAEPLKNLERSIRPKIKKYLS
jgi:glycosyltransferase involved in cell wall biosynthesis